MIKVALNQGTAEGVVVRDVVVPESVTLCEDLDDGVRV